MVRWDNKVQVMTAVKRDGWKLENASDELKADREVVMAATKQYGKALKYASEEIRSDRETILLAVKQDGRALRYASDELKNDHEIVLAALNKGGHVLKYASDELRSNREIVLAAVMQDGGTYVAGGALKYASDELKADPDIILAAIGERDGAMMHDASVELKNYRKIGLAPAIKRAAAIKRNGMVLKYSSEEFRNDRHIVLDAVKQGGHLLEYASEDLKRDHTIVLAAVKQSGGALQYASAELKGNYEIAMAAIKEDPGAVQHVSTELRNDISAADQLHHLCSKALQLRQGAAYDQKGYRYRSWEPVRAWFDQHPRAKYNLVLLEKDYFYVILNLVYSKDAPYDIIERFLQFDLTLLQRCMLASSRAKEPYNDERRNTSWDPVRHWFERNNDISATLAQKLLEETNHAGETVLDCVGCKQAPKDICEAIENLQAQYRGHSSNQTGNNTYADEATLANSASTLLELCGKALYPDFELDEIKRSDSWEPVREWFTNNIQCQDSLLQLDSRGRTPLHIACCKKAPLDIVRQMLKSDVDSAAARQKDKEEESHNMLPLHWACSTQCCAETILLIFKAYPIGANKRNLYGITPFKLAHGGVVEELVGTIIEYDQEWLGSCQDFMCPEIFERAVLKHHDSPNCISWLNKLSCSRQVVFYMMLEFYLHVALILSFVQASRFHLTEIDSKPGWSLAILPISGAFFLLEVWQCWGYMKINQPSGYILDLWNWVDLTAIGLSIASAIKLLNEVPVLLSIGLGTGTQRLLETTAFFLCIFFLSYLRKTFLSFAIFVGGIVNVVVVLIPFLVVSFLLLGAFAFGYFVQSNGTQSLEGSLLTVYYKFAGADYAIDDSGEESEFSALDIIFGLLVIIVLLNVVIAVVSGAWVEVMSKSQEVYWRYRLRYILEVTRSVKSNSCNCLRTSDLNEILDEDWTAANLRQYLVDWRYPRAPQKKKPHDWLKFGATIFLLFCMTVLGVISFGLFWPMFVLEFLFTSKDVPSSVTKTSADDAIKKLIVENDKKKQQIEKHLQQIEMQTERIKQENDKKTQQIEKHLQQIEMQTQQIKILHEKEANETQKIALENEKQSHQIENLSFQMEQLSRNIQLLVKQKGNKGETYET